MTVMIDACLQAVRASIDQLEGQRQEQAAQTAQCERSLKDAKDAEEKLKLALEQTSSCKFKAGTLSDPCCICRQRGS